MPDTNRYSDIDTNAWQDEFDKLDKNRIEFYEIDAMEASDSFQVMADFAEQLTDSILKEKTYKRLTEKKTIQRV